MFQGNVPPDILKGTIARYLLPTGNEPGDIMGIDIVALLIGDSVHSGRCVEVEKRGIVGFLVEATQKEVLTTKPSNNPSLI